MRRRVHGTIYNIQEYCIICIFMRSTEYETLQYELIEKCYEIDIQI